MEASGKLMPLLALRGIIVFPGMTVNLDVGRDKSINAVNAAMQLDKKILLVTQRDAETADPKREELYNYGVVAEIKQLLKLPSGAIRILIQGLERAELTSLIDAPFKDTYLEGFAMPVASIEPEENSETEAMRRVLLQSFEKWLVTGKKVTTEVMLNFKNITTAGEIADIIAGYLTISIDEKEELLELADVKERMHKLHTFLCKELEIAELEKNITQEVRKQIEKNQREYYLREQIKVINKELGEGDERQAEVDEYKKQMEGRDLPPEVADKINKELDRLYKMPPMMAESGVIRNYVETLLALPWGIYGKDNFDLKHAEKVLNKDHYGLEKVKERILEYLAVRALTKSGKGPILCLVGPPGVGKTSLAQSVARAIDRNFTRMSLGGVHDEAEIRGHRRTYIGAMPGRIIQAIKQAGTRNPVIVLDEVDKLGSDFRGDPSSALLEVLDPEQNHTFSDHYLNVPFDLSKVMFLCTANHLETIPAPLRDRMEVISLPGYTMQEKVEIAKRHLLPKKVTENGLREGDVIMDDTALTAVIRGYTREAGLRNLERELGSICRKLARQRAEGKKGSFTVDSAMVEKLLGAPRFIEDEKDKRLMPGMALGLAWTPAGGEVLTIECACMKGKGNLQLTGQLGDVMKESARIAMSYIRSRADSLGIDADFSDTQDIHIHVPAGAVPKDGPSAGVTLTSALISTLSGRIVRADTCMTGEITLQGRVLPVGGIKEKILAGVARGLKHVIIPSQNVKDLEEVPKELLKKIKVHPAHTYDDVLALAFEPVKKTAARARKAAPATEKK